MEGTAILTSIIEILVGGITGVATGLGEGITSLFKSLFFTTSGETETLSIFAILVIVFAGISLALALCRWVINFFTSLGQRNR